MDDPRDQNDRSITGCFPLSKIKDKEFILQRTLQFQSLLALPWFPFVGLLSKKVKAAASRFVLKTKALKKYQYKKDEVVKNKAFNDLFDGVVMDNKYLCMYSENAPKPKAPSDKDTVLCEKSRYLYWEFSIWSAPPNIAMAAFCEGDQSPLAEHLKYFVKNGFPTFSGEFYRESMMFWAAKNTEPFHNSNFQKFMAMHLQQLGLHLNLFFNCQTNRDLIFKTNNNGQLIFKNMFDINFKDFQLYPIPMAAQLLTGAAKRCVKGKNQKQYVTILLYHDFTI